MRSIEGHASTLVLAALLAYFVVFAAGAYTGDPSLQLAADVLFGVVAVGLGLVLLVGADPRVSPAGVAGLALATGGVGFLAYLATGVELLGALGTLFVIAGIAGYVYAMWAER